MKRFNFPGTNLVIVGAEPQDITFAHEEFGEFNVTDILEQVYTNPEAYGPWNVEIFDKDAEMYIRDRDPDWARIDELMGDPEQALRLPIVFVDLKGQALLIDGLHRFLLAHKLRRKQIMAFMVPAEIANKYRVKYFAKVKGKMVPVNWDTAVKQTFGMHTDSTGRLRK